ncbi:hypothetical protein M0805_005763 [Coniferiporia weirii]|nr:hypothetical protein M0805_005763 [Coniferiporia weirii]
MSRGVIDSKNADDASITSDQDAKIPDERSRDVIADPTSSSQATTSTAGGADTTAAPSADELRERSPGPHLEEMANNEEEGGFIRVNGVHQGMGGLGDSGVGLSSSRETNSSEQNQEPENLEPDLRRVKVYELVGSRWTDRGTAFCCGDFDNEAEEARLVARAETTQEVLLNCLIRATDVYQRQQDTLIVWTEPDGTDFALSFQDIEGCSEVWEFIVEVQKHLNNRVPSTAAQIIQSGHLPTPTPDAHLIVEIEKAMRTMARSPKSRENICSYIQDNKYIHRLLDAFEIAEKEENLDALHALCSCMQTILLLNEHLMYEHILMDELWMGVVSMLEYDPEFPKYKANYREFLLQRSRFLQPVVIADPIIERKIIHTYRLQYLKDVILGRALDDSTFNVLNSCIIFNQIDIINHIQQGQFFLKELVNVFIRPSTEKGKGNGKDGESSMEIDKPSNGPSGPNGVDSPYASSSSSQSHQPEHPDDIDHKKEVISLLQQLCVMGKNVQLPTRISLFRTLVERGVLYAVQWALCRSEKHLISTAGEIFAVLLDHHTLSVRVHVLSQATALGQPTGQSEGLPGQEPAKIQDVVTGPPPFKETLSQVLCRILVNSQDLALQNQFADALRMITDVPLIDPVSESQAGVPRLLNRPVRDDHSTERYLDNFYKVCVDTLFRPLTHDVPEHHELKNTPFAPSRERSNLYLYLCDLLCSFAIQHSFRSFFFILSSNVVSRVATLLSVRDKHLCLAALRFFRICLKMNNRNLFTHMHKHECFTPITNLAIREARRENLLSSACQEFFEFMRKENLKDPINHIMEKHEGDMRELAKTAFGARTFQDFISRWEINKEPLPPEAEKRPPIIVPRVLGQRVMESEEEESYFNSDDNDDDPVVPVPRVDSFLGMARRRRQRNVPGPGVQANRGMRPMSVPSHQRPTSPLSSLLEYDDDEEPSGLLSNQPRPGEESATPGSPVLPHRQIQILPYEPSEREPADPEDDLLEALVSKKADVMPPARAGAPPKPQVTSEAPPMRLREKRRRRDDEDEDDVLERLAPKNRRVSNPGGDQAAAKAWATMSKVGEDGPKKLKLRLSSSKPIVETKPAAPPRTDSKDGGNG